MTILVLFAFLAGVVTILSPCILPILPIVLSGSLTGGKGRPLGIITGFILSFTFFTLFLSTIVRVTGISADAVRQISVLTIFTFGLSLIVPQFRRLMEGLFSKLAATGKSKQSTVKQDFTGGIAVGLSLGLVWAPCVGPILASVITLALTGTVTASAFIVTLAYSIGTAIPMLAITYGGRNLLSRIPWLTSHTDQIQKTFGVLMIITAIAIFFNWDRKFQTYILSTFPNYGVGLTKFEDNPLVKKALESFNSKPADQSSLGKPMYDLVGENLGKAAEFIPGGQWFNSDPLTLAGLRGKVVLVDFWTYTCINCIRTLPYLKNWHTKYKDKGLVIVGVHTPEFEFEKNPDNVQEAIADFDLDYPIMQDNDYATWRAYDNHYWPAKYLVDKEGKIRYTHFGEGEYDQTEKKIQELLGETGAAVDVQLNNPQYRIFSRTPELYLGYDRIAHFASPERILPNREETYSVPGTVPSNSVAYGGAWTVGWQYAMPKQGATLILHFDAGEVFLVMRPITGTGKIRVTLDDGVPAAESGEDVKESVITVDADRLYRLIKLNAPGTHILKLEFLDDNVELYAFTFG